MPINAADYYCTVQKNGTGTFLARIVDSTAAAVVPANIAAVSYSVFLLDDQDADAREPVSGHQAVPLAVAEVLYVALQNGPPWTIDAVGYNFCHTLDVSAQPAFPIAGRRYLLEYRLLPVAGQVILLRFRVNVI